MVACLQGGEEGVCEEEQEDGWRLAFLFYCGHANGASKYQIDSVGWDSSNSTSMDSLTVIVAPALLSRNSSAVVVFSVIAVGLLVNPQPPATNWYQIV